MSHVSPPQSSFVVSSHPDEESLPTIAFYCSCRKRLYRVSTNVVGMLGHLKCEKCGKHYVWLDSPIALAVSSARAAKALIANLEPSLSFCCNAGKRDRHIKVASSPTRK